MSYEERVDTLIREGKAGKRFIDVYKHFQIDTESGLCLTNGNHVKYDHWRTQIIASLKRNDANKTFADSERAKWQALRE